MSSAVRVKVAEAWESSAAADGSADAGIDSLG